MGRFDLIRKPDRTNVMIKMLLLKVGGGEGCQSGSSTVDQLHDDHQMSGVRCRTRCRRVAMQPASRCKCPCFDWWWRVGCELCLAKLARLRRERKHGCGGAQSQASQRSEDPSIKTERSHRFRPTHNSNPFNSSLTAQYQALQLLHQSTL
jgi:hypothetical protein